MSSTDRAHGKSLKKIPVIVILIVCAECGKGETGRETWGGLCPDKSGRLVRVPGQVPASLGTRACPASSRGSFPDSRGVLSGRQFLLSFLSKETDSRDWSSALQFTVVNIPAFPSFSPPPFSEHGVLETSGWGAGGHSSAPRPRAILRG